MNSYVPEGYAVPAALVSNITIGLKKKIEMRKNLLITPYAIDIFIYSDARYLNLYFELRIHLQSNKTKNIIKTKVLLKHGQP